MLNQPGARQVLFPFKPNYRVCLVSFITFYYIVFGNKRGEKKKKNWGARDFFENSLHNRRFMSQARRRLLLALRAECGMLRSPHLAFIKRLLSRLLEKKKKKSGNVGSGILLSIPCFKNCDENYSL